MSLCVCLCSLSLLSLARSRRSLPSQLPPLSPLSQETTQDSQPASEKHTISGCRYDSIVIHPDHPLPDSDSARASRAVEGGVLKRAAREKEERGGRATTRGPQAGNTSGGRRHGITQSGAAGGQAGGRGRLGRLLRLLALLLVVLENDSHRHAELHRVADLGRQSWLVWGEGRGGTVWRQAGRLVSTRACVSPA